LALLTNGTVSVWGNGSSGSTNLPAGLSNVAAVAAGENFGLALKGDGTVIGWGGQNGEGVPPLVSDAAAIAAGLAYGLILRSNGTVIAWGWNLYGITNVPPGLSNVVAIAAGGYHGTALKNDGTVVVWGGQDSGVQPPPGLTNVVAISAGLWHTLAVKQDGTVVTWGYNAPIPPAALTNVVAISAGYSHSLALTASQVPILGAQPNNVTLNAGGATSFTIQAFGQSLCYQWQLNGANLSGATTSTLNLTNVQSADAGTYRVVVTNSAGTATSEGASLSVNPFLAITKQPQNQTGYVGNTATLSVTAVGSTPLNYQWTKGNGVFGGATSSSLVFSNLQSGDAGTYAVIVTNVVGSRTSASVTLTVNANPMPVITASPKSQPIFPGELLVLDFSVNGSPPLSYQWQKDGTTLAGQTGTNLVIADIQPAGIGAYTVVVTNASGSVTSAPAVLTLIPSPFVSAQRSTVVSLGGPALPDGLNDIVAIASGFGGFGQQLAVRSNGTVVVWGYNLSPSASPPPDLSNVVTVASGSTHSIALKRDGTVVGWGTKSTPPAGLSGVVAIASGLDHSIALKADGTVVGWGISTPAPPAGSNLVAVTAASDQDFGLRGDGTVTTNSQLFGFPGASNIAAIAGGSSGSLVMLRNDGTVSGWRISVPAGLSNVVAVSSGLALRSDGTVVGLDGTAPAGLTNATAISGGVGRGLVLTTNPPPPILSGSSSASNFLLSTRLSVPGYVLEGSDTPTGPFSVVESYTNATASDDFVLPLNSPKKYYRLRKQ